MTSSGSYLVRLGPPSRGDTIHRNDCPYLKRANGRALRWAWADKNPDTDFWLEAPWLNVCGHCKPPRRLRELAAARSPSEGPE